MTPKESIKNLKDIIAEYADGMSGSQKVALFESIELLKKQIPQNPRHESRNYFCPKCRTWLLWSDAEPNENDVHCPKCSQKIDWSDCE